MKRIHACARNPAPIVLAALLAACTAAEPPATPDAPNAPAAAAPFDYGEVKTAAEYLAEPRWASADLGRGELLSFACAACHSFNEGGKTIIGPNLHGVFGRPAGTVPGFEYSPALAASDLVWTPTAVEAWLAEPQRFVPGTTMAFTGFRSADDRRDLIAYLLRVTQ